MGIPLAVLSGLVMILGCLFTLPDVATLLAARKLTKSHSDRETGLLRTCEASRLTRFQAGGTPVPVILSTVTGSQAGGTVRPISVKSEPCLIYQDPPLYRDFKRRDRLVSDPYFMRGPANGNSVANQFVSSRTTWACECFSPPDSHRS
jgi:hypothetical protein